MPKKIWIFTILLSVVLTSTAAAKAIVVVDDSDSSPIIGATVFSQSGTIVGLTDDDGKISIASKTDYPITIRCLGYEPATISFGNSTVRLTHNTYELKEVVITPVDRPIARIICYIREYTSGATAHDTLMNYNEHMGDFFIPTKKVKGFRASASPRFLRSRLYSRRSDSSGLDSIFTPEYRDDTFAWESLVEMPKRSVRLSENIINGASCDTVMGKHGIKEITRNNGDYYTSQIDHLADIKDHTLSPFIFKLLGLTLDISELQANWAFKPNKNGTYTAPDIMSGTFSLKITGRGRWIKKAFKTDSPVEMYSFYELYPVDVEYLTVEEAKTLRNGNPPDVKIKRSPNAPPLAPSIQRIVDTLTK